MIKYTCDFDSPELGFCFLYFRLARLLYFDWLVISFLFMIVNSSDLYGTIKFVCDSPELVFCLCSIFIVWVVEFISKV